MAQPVSINCPKCKTRLMVPAESLGAKVQCPNCKVTLQTQAPKAPAAAGSPKPPPPAAKPPSPSTPKAPGAPQKPATQAPAPAPADPEGKKNSYAFEEDEGPAQYGVNKEDDTPRCPNCAEELEDERDVICVNCGYNLRERVLYRTRKMVHKGFWDYMLWHSIAILFTILIICIIVWNVLVFTKLPEWLGGPDSTGGWIVSSTFFRLWNTIFSLFGIWSLGKFAFIRFFLHPHPPEEEIHNH